MRYEGTWTIQCEPHLEYNAADILDCNVETSLVICRIGIVGPDHVIPRQTILALELHVRDVSSGSLMISMALITGSRSRPTLAMLLNSLAIACMVPLRCSVGLLGLYSQVMLAQLRIHPGLCRT
jgi:hypothetical protein